MKKIQMFLFILTASLFVGCSSDDVGGSGSESPIKNLSQIVGDWELIDIKNHDGEILLPECSRTGSKLEIKNSNSTLVEYRRTTNANNESMSCANVIYEYVYDNLKIINISNLQAERGTNTKYRFSAVLIGVDELKFYLYQIENSAGIQTITSDKQVVFYYKKM